MSDQPSFTDAESTTARYSIGESLAVSPPTSGGGSRPFDLGSEAPSRIVSFTAEWRESYGRTWWLDLACLGAVIFLLGAMQPLSDPDLPMHLATGEWIVHHRGVPFVEPFAWTRAGAPYYAYSWAVELVYYQTMLWWGPVGLHLLNGGMLLAAAAAMLVLAGAAGWRPWVAFCMAALNVGIAMIVVAALRPQLVLFTLVPLAWACTFRILGAPSARGAVSGLFLTSAVAANSHLFFVLTAAPIALIVANPPADRRRGWAVCLAVAAGWLLSPYGLTWPAVFRLNFGYNALLVQPSPILEFHPGFRPGLWLLLVLPLALLPWAISSNRLHRRERIVHAALWVAGLLAFGYAGRLLLCWWLITLPATAIALEHLGGAGRTGTPRRRVKIATYAVAVASVVTISTVMFPAWRGEGDSKSRRLPTEASASIEPLLVWLECHLQPGANGRIYSWFNYGSYLSWRLPGFSTSIDGRTIFPDSVARPEMLRSGWLAPPPYRVWHDADVAIIPRAFAVAATLDTAQAWKLVASSRRAGHPAGSVGLWVNRGWWGHAGNAPLPEQAELLTIPGSSSGAPGCAATKVSWGPPGA